jgi:replicative superfamily II helicase
LWQPLDRLGVALKMKSGDTGPVSASHPSTVLITTPESTDSLLTRAPRLLATLDAVVLDEIHLFDGGPRAGTISVVCCDASSMSSAIDRKRWAPPNLSSSTALLSRPLYRTRPAWRRAT